MKEKNNMFLMMIAVVALIAIVGGAAYAYFASSITPGEGLNLDVTAEASTAQFTASGGNISVHIDGSSMQQSNAGSVAVFTSGQIKVTLQSETNATCTFDLRFAWDDGVSYVPTKQLSVGEYEFSVLTIASPSSYDNYVAGYWKDKYQDVQFDVLTASESTGGYGGYIAKGEKIIATGGNTTNVNYNFDVILYNLNHDQSALAGNGTKTYSGRFYVDNVVC